jgi:sec-independent protein translocase protein TatB
VGLSFGEIVVLALVALVVIGPKDLPKLLRAAGRFIGQAKRAVADVKRETGLDEVLRGDFQDLERLADHIEDMGPYRGDAPAGQLTPREDAFRLREYPRIGADAGMLIPEDASVYDVIPPNADDSDDHDDAKSRPALGAGDGGEQERAGSAPSVPA